MKGRVFSLVILVGLVWGCTRDLQVTVVFDQTKGLQAKDRVFWDKKTIGEVKALEPKPDGRIAARLRIQEDSRGMVTDQARFLIQPDPERDGHRAVEMILIGRGGKPLPDEAEVEGASPLSAALEQGSREIQDWAKRFQEEVDRWEKELGQLPKKEWYKQLERQMEDWRKDLEKGGAEAQQRFQREVLPRLEDALRGLKRWLEEQGRGKDAQPLEKKLDELKGI
jgi:hypothetical protein